MQLTIVAAGALIALSGPDATKAHERSEVARVQFHLDGALAMMARRDLSELSAAQGRKREDLVRELQAYRNRGVFPINRDFPTRLVPYFVDPVTGVHCAVGHLLAITGNDGLVERVVRTDNHVRVRSLAGDAEFVRWLEDHGLTLDEAARIQPTYGNPLPAPPLSPPHERNRVHDLALSSASIGTSVLAWTVDPGASARWPALIGTAVGAYTFGRGAYYTHISDQNRPAAIGMAAIGAVSGALAWRAYRRRVDPAPAPANNDSGRQVSIMPIVDFGRQANFGASFSIRF